MMDALDLYYRAYLEYKKLLSSDQETINLQRAARTLNKPNHENLLLTYYECTIQEDWILGLEKALPFLEKAIKEDRQFIRNDQDVLPIEKVRKTSRQSIQDLSKRSDYITRKPDPNSPATITPDKLMIVRKENDYTVYENRVLYTTVLYAKEFVESRLQIIKDTITKYEGRSSLHKTLDNGNRKLELQLLLHETRKNDPYALEKSKVQDLLVRIENIFTMLLAFLKMPLLAKFGQPDLVKRPITKTNVLKINLNFKNTLALYDFLVDYNEPGYTLTQVEESLAPFSSAMVEDFSHVGLLMSFFTYQYANRITDQLGKRYFEEEERRQKEKEDQLIEHLRRIHLDIAQSGKTLDQYLLMFEEGYRILEKRVELLKREIKDIQSQHQKDMFALKQTHEVAMQTMKDTHQNEIQALEENHQAAIQSLENAHQTALQLLESQHQNQIDTLTNEHEAAIQQLQAEMAEQMEQLKQSFAVKENEWNSRHQESQQRLKAQEEAQVQLQLDRDLLKGEVLVLKEKQGQTLHIDDFTSKDRFAELERVYQAYQKIFSKTWQATKKAIRKEILSQPPTSVRKDDQHGKKEE